MAIAERELSKRRAKPLLGHAKPRIAPPIPARSRLAEFKAAAERMGITLMPWQETAVRYLTALGPDGRRLYREVCIVVARQNGKTTLMKPYIATDLRAGNKIMHIAQNRELPREMFGFVADALSEEPELFPKRRGRVIWPRFGSGQEEILLVNGGKYRIAAASRGGARGHPNDDVIFDELLEMTTFDAVAAAEPTMTMSPDPQMVYLSNMGDDESVVLQSVRDRAGKDENLAYLEWSAAPEREPDDREGWAEANPALGHYPSVLRTLEAAYRRHKLAGTMNIFEMEHLCRYQPTRAPGLVDMDAWMRGHLPVEDVKRPMLGIAMDPSGTRASAAIAWQQSDGSYGVQVIADVNGDPIDVGLYGKDLSALAMKLRCVNVGYSALTDAELAKHFRKAQKIDGREYGNASENFSRLVAGGQIRWHDADQITDDLAWTSRKAHDGGTWHAVKAKDDHPVTSVQAAIRAVWLVSGPQLSAPRFQ